MTEDQWISFQLAAETYAHSVASVREIIPYAKPTPVPGAPSSVAGILNIRGNVVPIISGRRLFGLNEPEHYTEQGRVIILELGSELTGITVDAVGEIVTIAENQMDWNDYSSHNNFIKGTAKLEQGLFILTDVSQEAISEHA